MLIPLLSYSNDRLDEPRADGAVFSFLVLAFAAFTLWQQRQLRVIPGSRFLAAATVCGIFPLFLAAQGQNGWAPSLGGLADRAPLLSAWVLVCALVSWPRLDKQWLVRALVVVGAAASLYALPQAFGWNPPGWQAMTRVPSFPYAGIIHAVEVVLPLLLLALAALPTLQQAPRLWLCTVVPLALHVGVIGSNAGRLGLVAGGLVLLRAVPARRAGLAIAVTLVMVGELSRALGGASGLNTGDLFPTSTALRPSMYSDAIQHAATTPLGIGIGRFQTSFPAWRSEETSRILSNDWTISVQRTPKTIHSEPLMVWLEFGWLGTALLLVGLWRVWKQRQSGAHADAIFDTTPAWFALLVSAAVRSPFTDNPVALALAALLLGLDLRAARATQPAAACATPQRWRLAVSSAVVLGIAVLAAPPAWAQWRGEQLLVATLRDEDHLNENLLAATEVRPWDTQSWVLLGSFYLAHEDWNWARDCFYEALWYDATNLPALIALMRVEMQAPDANEAKLVALLARAEQFAPKNKAVVEARVTWLRAHHSRFQQQAVHRVEQGLPGAGPWWAATFLAEAQIAAAEGRMEDARNALFRASSLVPRNKGLVERSARQENLEQQMIGKLTRKVFPTWPRIEG